MSEPNENQRAISHYRIVSKMLALSPRWARSVKLIKKVLLRNWKSRLPISTGGGEEPHWAANGRELYYRNASSLMVVPIQTGALIQAGTPKMFFNEAFDLRSNTGQTFDGDPRGGRLLMIRPRKEDAAATIKVVLNWFSELSRLAPAN